MHILLVGFGNMGRALARGWRASAADQAQITVFDTSATARERALALGFVAPDALSEVQSPIDIAVLAVKPAQLETVLGDCPAAGLYVSIAAGRTIADIAAMVSPDAAVVRAMPNTPAAIGQGITGLCANAIATARDRELATELLSAVGEVEWLDQESDIDAVTAVSGSGPAYVFLLIESLTAAAIELGLDSQLAERLATATVRGAGAYAAQSDADAQTLRRQVTSPNGTTAAAIEILSQDDAFKKLLLKAVKAAARRSRELGSGRAR